MSTQSPTRDRIIIETDKPKEKTDFGLLLNEDWKSLLPTGTVLAVGPGVLDVRPGDRVVFERYASIILEGQQRMCLEKHIMAIITGE